MKKQFFIALCAVGLTFALSSCTKEYTCTCISVDSSGTLDDIVTTATIEGSKSDAEQTCDNSNSTVGTITTTCALD